MNLPVIKGRGSQINPVHRFARIEMTADWEQLEHDDDHPERRGVRTEYFVDDAQSIISENDSPEPSSRGGMAWIVGTSRSMFRSFAIRHQRPASAGSSSVALVWPRRSATGGPGCK